MQNLVSIIVPCYNQSQYLDECLQSVLEQTYHNWECIIVNDGSTDVTDDVVKKWLEADERFIYIQKINGGVSSARNIGIEKSRGKWILPLDGDDKIGNRYLELASKEFDNQDIIYCKADYFGEKNEAIIQYNFDKSLILLENQLFCTSFFKKSDWEKVNGFDEKMNNGYEDWEFWIRMISLRKTCNVKRLDYKGFFYRIKTVSKNTQAMYINDSEIKTYIYLKHQNLYLENLGNFVDLLHENMKLQLKIIHLKEILNSKRYRVVNKIFKFLKL